MNGCAQGLVLIERRSSNLEKGILVPRGHARFGQHQESRHLGWSSQGAPTWIQHRKSAIHGFHAKCEKFDWLREYETNTMRMLKKSGPARGHVLCADHRSAASGDENGKMSY